MSRSGVTILTGRALGVSRVEAATFSFLLMGPVILAAAGLRAFELVGEGASGSELAALGVAAVVSGLAGVLAARWLLGYLRHSGLGVFALYRVAVGAAALVLLAVRG